MRGTADILHGSANILRGAADICLPNTQCFGIFQGEKYTFFQKFSKIGLVAEKLLNAKM